MKILITSDLHQWIPKWKEAIRACKTVKPDFIIIAGDLLPKENSFGGQMNFLPHMKKYALQMKAEGCEVVLTLGNDDNQNAQEFMEQEDSNGTWHYIHNKTREIKGYEFAGLSFVRDHPFGYKYWCRNEFQGQTFIDSVQLCDPLLLDSKHKTFVIKDYKQFLNDQPAIMTYLSDLAGKVKNISKSIWVIHNPPYMSGLDRTARGLEVGSTAVFQFIDKFQPLLTAHGHIHESPSYTGKWCREIGDTLAVQAGQITQELHYAVVEIEDGKIINKTHSLPIYSYESRF